MKTRRKRIIKVKTKKLANSFKYALAGIITSFRKERNMKIHFFIMLLVIICGFLLKISLIEWFICIIWFAVVIGGELFNTAIETTVNIVMPFRNPKAKAAKDISAGAVLILAIGAATSGLIIFIPKIVEYIRK
ncbi:MAG: diacylglycerol kinase family protein [Clostridia bacterium]|nr:diacylglycerol kinase family protein [Clostridia bacterium]